VSPFDPSLPLNNRRVVLGVSGSIAAFKACAVASALVQLGARLDVVMTPAAARLVQPLSFQAITHRPVLSDLWHLQAEAEIGHVTLGHQAELLIVAPATANTLAKLAHGLADDPLSSTALATRAPLLIAPAMDGGMYEHPATQANVATLRQRGALILEPEVGHLASGLSGRGRLVAPETIVDAARWLLGRDGDLAGCRLVVTAGGTQEAIDPVRVITNRSSGKMGYAVATAARDRGAEVTLVSAPTCLTPPFGVRTVAVTSAAEMLDAVLAAAKEADLLVMAAAVADFRPARPVSQKIKKSDEALTIELAPTVDILRRVAALPAAARLVRVGFAAESQNTLANARAKLREKHLDLIVANDIAGPQPVFGADENEVTILDASGNARALPRQSKLAVAHALLDAVLPILHQRGWRPHPPQLRPFSASSP